MASGVKITYNEATQILSAGTSTRRSLAGKTKALDEVLNENTEDYNLKENVGHEGSLSGPDAELFNSSSDAANNGGF